MVWVLVAEFTKRDVGDGFKARVSSQPILFGNMLLVFFKTIIKIIFYFIF
jgi:hypothetical protein